MRLVPMTHDPVAETHSYPEDHVELALSDETYKKMLAGEEEYTQPMLARLEAALAQLNETEQSLLLLKAQQFSYDEIAQMLGLENNQLKVRHFRAKQRLITLFNQTQP
jgi:RNA polymerase sigma-70 factor (ECF subfamily)